MAHGIPVAHHICAFAQTQPLEQDLRSPTRGTHRQAPALGHCAASCLGPDLGQNVDLGRVPSTCITPPTHGGSPHRSWPMPFSPTVCEALRLVSHALCASFIRTIVPNRFTCSRLALPSRCFVPISGTLLVPLIFCMSRAFREPSVTLANVSHFAFTSTGFWNANESGDPMASRPSRKRQRQVEPEPAAQKMIIRTFSVSFELVGKFEFEFWAPRKYFSIRHQFYAFGAYLHKLLFKRGVFFVNSFLWPSIYQCVHTYIL